MTPINLLSDVIIIPKMIPTIKEIMTEISAILVVTHKPPRSLDKLIPSKMTLAPEPSMAYPPFNKGK